MQDDILKSGIYCIENLINNKKYIGQSVDIKDRWRRHQNELNNHKHHNNYLQNAWDKYGENSFAFYILELCPNNLLDEKEIYYIKYHNTTDRSKGYNLQSGGQSCNFHSNETKKKISASNKKAYLNSNLKQIRSSDALKQWSNPKIKEKITGVNNGMYGKHHSETTKQKMSEKKKGKPSPKRNLTPVLCVELNKIYNCAADAAKELGISNTILEVCYGHRHTAGGYHWKFISENNIS